MPKELTTATVQQLTNPPPALPVSGETAGILGGAVMTLVGAVLWLRRKTSRDGLEVFKDRTEGALLKTALEDRDRAMSDAREAWSQLNAMQRSYGQLDAENGYLKEQLRVNLELVTEMRRGVQNVGRTVDIVKDRMEKTSAKTGISGPAPLEGKP